MYCTNSKSTKLHVYLADIIEMCGGSRSLIKLFNQLGVVASADTHDKFVTYITERERKKSLRDSLLENIFSIASVDNFDMLQSHVAVYCGDQHRSYHGTTNQVVQPDPTVGMQCKRKFTNSPDNSAHKHGKVGPKRPRTLFPRDLTHSMLQVCDVSPVANVGAYRRGTLTLEGFLEQLEERIERIDLESKLFSYMFAKHKLPQHLIMKDFKALYAENKCKDTVPSNIYYLETPRRAS